MSPTTSKSYSPVAVALHWAAALFVLLNLAIGFFMEGVPKTSPRHDNVLFYHASFGILVLTLMGVRLAWRLTHMPPPLPHSIPKAQQAAAHGLHGVLYLLLLAQPISGYVHRMAGAHPVSFFGLFDLPMLVAKNEPLRLLTDAIHDTGAFVIALLVAGHIAVALKHRFIDRDGVMERMLPGRQAAQVSPGTALAGKLDPL